MTVLTPTKSTGAVTKQAPGLSGEPDRLVTDEVLAEQVSLDGLNTPFVADLLSGALTHERCGRHLYRSVAERTNNPILGRHYRHFGEETEHHVEVLEHLVTAVGGNPAYVSPYARAVEASDSKLLEATFLTIGALDPMTAEMAMLDAVFAAEAVDHANWEALRSLCQHLPSGQLREVFETAVTEILAQEEEHFGWARETRAKLVTLQATSATAAKAGQKMEEAVSRIRDWLT